MQRFCDELRWEREQRNVSIETICAVTKVSLRHVLALEAGEYSELPGGVFRKGILRSYLGVLGLEEMPGSSVLKPALGVQIAKAVALRKWAEFAENIRRTRVTTRPQTRKRWLGVAGMFALLAFFAWLVWMLVVHRRLEATQPTAQLSLIQMMAPKAIDPTA